MLLSEPIISLAIFLTFLIFLTIRIWGDGFLHLAKKIREQNSGPVLDRLLALFTVLFLVAFVVINIIPFRFVNYNEADTKYDYSFYLNANQELKPDQPLGGYGTNLGGLYVIFSMMYKLLTPQTIFESITLDKILITFMFLISFFLVRRIISFFLPGKGRQRLIQTLLTFLYFSLPQITYYFWQQKFYYMSAHFFFLISFFFLIQCLEGGSSLDFLLYITAGLISFQTRPEFAFFFLYLLVFLSLQYLKFSPFGFRKLGAKERNLLILNVLLAVLVIWSYAEFLKGYGGVAQSVSYRGLLDSLNNYIMLTFGLYSRVLMAAILLLCACSIVISARRRRFAVLTLIFLVLLMTLLLPRAIYVDWMSMYFLILPAFIIFSQMIDWLTVSLGRSGAGIISCLMVILIVLSTLFMITGELNPLINQDYTNYPTYSRTTELSKVDTSLRAYNTLKSGNYIIIDRWGGNFYFSYLLKDTNNTVIGIFGTEGLNRSQLLDNTRPKLIFSRGRECNNEQVLGFITGLYNEYSPAKASQIQEDYNWFVGYVSGSNITYYSSFSGAPLCEIAPSAQE